MAAHRNREIEAKFLLPGLDAVRRRVLDLGGIEMKARAFERNLLFDTPDGRLRKAKEILRLRLGQEATLTFKRRRGDIEEREEIEVRIEDPETLRALLEALHFQVVFIYEKYRQVLELDQVSVMLDELPFGDFAEVEGPSMEQVRRLCGRLGLQWERRLLASYQMLFETLVVNRELSFQDATFSNFDAVSRITKGDLETVCPPGTAGDVG
jgi:adenylate cyclase class 2